MALENHSKCFFVINQEEYFDSRIQFLSKSVLVVGGQPCNFTGVPF